MSDVTVYHPGLGTQAQVPESAVPHLRMSGWLTLDEHQANTAAAEAREQEAAEQEAAPAASSKTAAKKGQ